jgi:hypothetical protein
MHSSLLTNSDTDTESSGAVTGLGEEVIQSIVRLKSFYQTDKKGAVLYFSLYLDIRILKIGLIELQQKK